MRKIKRVTAIIMLAMVATLGAPQAFAGEMGCPGAAGTQESPGISGTIDTPGIAGDMQTPGATGDISFPGLDGWMSTGLYVITSLLG